nr:MAG TPA: hypothetical protein [Caudoviricetes sp.]
MRSSSSMAILSHYPPDTMASGRLRAPSTTVQFPTVTLFNVECGEPLFTAVS